ncbi:heparan-alpha-glucosaminide N-acetyltransferase domain-containing protein, partial [Hallella bergensis]|uniref:heparan-alpha-glucosaminide N-acetyltransferase domain-containing protein n=1 Tax=Hallella bergensis TaxID=242750 RepID=UPI00399072C9
MPQQRLISLDVLRGLTVMLMIFVNNGAGTQIFSPLRHSRWNGMTLCDLVFPFFLFMVGVSTYLSLRKSNFAWSAKTLRRIARRTALLFLIGLAIN